MNTAKRPPAPPQIGVRRALGELVHVWAGEVTAPRIPRLRGDLYALLQTPGAIRVRLLVDTVTAIDRSGVALLVGANRRAAAAGLSLVLIDNSGPVTQALARMHLLDQFLITQVIGNGKSGNGRSGSITANDSAQPLSP